MPPIDPFSWELNAKEVIALIDQQKENTKRIDALERINLVRSTAKGILFWVGSLAGSVLTFFAPYLIKYFFPHAPTP